MGVVVVITWIGQLRCLPSPNSDVLWPFRIVWPKTDVTATPKRSRFALRPGPSACRFQKTDQAFRLSRSRSRQSGSRRLQRSLVYDQNMGMYIPDALCMVIFGVKVGKYSIHGAYGYGGPAVFKLQKNPEERVFFFLIVWVLLIPTWH